MPLGVHEASSVSDSLDFASFGSTAVAVGGEQVGEAEDVDSQSLFDAF